jgi:hypothetical protein
MVSLSLAQIRSKEGKLMKNKSLIEALALLFGLALMTTNVSAAGSANGSGGDMPAYYDGNLFTINFKELPGSAEQALLAHNGSINFIYMCDQCEAQGTMFFAVLDAIQGDGFNPLWVEVQISFNAGNAPQQFLSDTEVLAAASGPTPKITLTVTDEVYRCAVVGPKKK